MSNIHGPVWKAVVLTGQQTIPLISRFGAEHTNPASARSYGSYQRVANDETAYLPLAKGKYVRKARIRFPSQC